jgi:putative transposase
MPRPPRLACPGALYHVTARGVQQSAIFVDDRDRLWMLALLAQALRDFEARALAFCLMGNHYHFVLQTERANLPELMHRINSRYGQAFNRRHDRRGHVFEGRFKAVHVDRDAYLLKVCRYVDLNPVRAGLVTAPADWRWSSYRAHAGAAPSPRWLATAELHAALMGRAPTDELQAMESCRRYADWVDAGRSARLWEDSLRHGVYLGDEAFVERMRRLEV